MTFSINPEQYLLLKQQDLEIQHLFLINVLHQSEEEIWKMVSFQDKEALDIQYLWRNGYLEVSNKEDIFEFQLTSKSDLLIYNLKELNEH